MDTKSAEKKKVLLMAAVGVLFVAVVTGSVIWGIARNSSKEEAEDAATPTDAPANEQETEGAEPDEGSGGVSGTWDGAGEGLTDTGEGAAGEESGEQDGTGVDTAAGNPEETTPEDYDPASLNVTGVTKEIREYIGADCDKLRPELYSYLMMNGISATKAVLMEDGTNINKNEQRITMNFQLDNPAASKIQATYTVQDGTYDFVLW